MNRAVALLILALMVCALMLVSSQQRSRLLFAEMNRLQLQERRLNQEWSRLEYEQRDLSKASRIVDSARKQLHMSEPRHDKTKYIKAQ